jgi:hypothetical protein
LVTYKPFPVNQFGGLNLVDDPQEIGAPGAVDLLNIDLDKQGRLRTRDGYDNFTASAAASRLHDLRSVQFTNGTRQVLVASSAGTSSFYRAYSTAGATVATQNLGLGVPGAYDVDFTRFGGPSAEVVYTSGRDVDPATGPGNSIPNYSWNGSAWSAVSPMGTGGFSPLMLEVQANDNRLVGAHVEGTYSRVGFSGAGTPETWGANDYVDLTPGDGERVTALVSWRELVFAFKETKYFVFTGNSTGGDGNPIFNYRPVNTGVGAVGRSCAVGTPNGVYFLSRRGIYRTVGGDPVLVSRAIDPIFRGAASSLFGGGVLNHAAITKCRLEWHDERLYFAYPSGSATDNDRLAVFDPESNQWILWDVAVNGMTSFRVGDTHELLFTYPTGSNHIGRLAPAYSTDDGTAIAARYQSGFYDLGEPGSTAFTRWTRLWGSGSPTVSVFTDFESSDTRAGAVTLGTAPALAHGFHLQSYEGQLFSHKISASAAFSVNRLQHDIAWTRQ